MLVGTAPISGVGNELANTITGNVNVNVLNGGAGADSLSGGGGNDTYYVNSTGDVVIEAAGNGIDVVNASLSWSLSAAVENLILLGSRRLDGSGNGLANTILGNQGRNTLDGGTGADRLFGGRGHDTYVVDNADDQVMESAGGGIDSVRSSLSSVLGQQVENLFLLGTAGLSGTGNALDNLLAGNSGNNALSAGAGDDTLLGSAGKDSLKGGLGSDVFLYRRFVESGPLAAQRDEILDFRPGDRLDVSHIDANDHLAGNQRFRFDADGSFSLGEIRQTLAGGDLLVEFNIQADVAAEMSLLLRGVSTFLNAGDILL